MCDARIATRTLSEYHSVKLEGVSELKLDDDAIDDTTSANGDLVKLRDAVQKHLNFRKGELLTFLELMDMGEEAEREGMSFFEKYAQREGGRQSGHQWIAKRSLSMKDRQKQRVKKGVIRSPLTERPLDWQFRDYCAVRCSVLRTLHEKMTGIEPGMLLL